MFYGAIFRPDNAFDGLRGFDAVILELPPQGAYAHAVSLGLLIPAYFSYCSNPGGWQQIARAAQYVPVIAIMDDDNGPGSAINNSCLLAIDSVHSTGGRMIGYVYTKLGQRSLTAVEQDVDTYYTFYPGIDGIFVDNMASQADTVLYYQELATYIRGRHPGALIVANAGNPFDEDYAQQRVADIFIDAEGTADWVNAQAQSAWTQNYPATTFAEIANQTSNDADEVSTLASRHVGWLYSTDSPPYSALPADFNDEIARIIDINDSR